MPFKTSNRPNSINPEFQNTRRSLIRKKTSITPYQENNESKNETKRIPTPPATLPIKPPIRKHKNTILPVSVINTPLTIDSKENIPNNFVNLSHQVKTSIIATFINNNETVKLNIIKAKLNEKIRLLNNQKKIIEKLANQQKKK